ncbi:MAG: electron transfer flavoprotein subunit alpha/FixB family protein [Clostridium sp.]|nr:electron transfer flavoprotein subunit alpha/FixB family protein [Clostridium sp.]
MKIGIFLETIANTIIPVGLELIGKTIEMMGDRSYTLHGIIAINKNQNNTLFDKSLKGVESYLDEVFIFEYEDEYLTTDHYREALCEYVENENPKILLLGATPLGRSFGPRVAAHFKTGITADCTEIKYDEKYGLIQIRPAYGEEILAEIVTPKTFPQMSTIRPGVMDPPSLKGNKKAEVTMCKRELLEKKLTILNRHEIKQDTKLDEAKIVVIAGNAIKEIEELDMIKKLAKVLGGEYAVTRPLVEGGLAPYSRQVGVSGTILSASVVLLLGVSGSNQTLSGIRKAKKIISVNNDPEAAIFKKVDIGIVDDWMNIAKIILEKKGEI